MEYMERRVRNFVGTVLIKNGKNVYNKSLQLRERIEVSRRFVSLDCKLSFSLVKS